jgi:site-specific DNA-cytosine methylase
LKIAVLFDGAGLARLGLEQAGHECIGFELDPWKHYLSLSVGSGRCELGDAREVDLDPFDAVWASPPCQTHSIAATQGPPKDQIGLGKFYSDGTLLAWSEQIDKEILWVENVDWHSTRHLPIYNAAQFIDPPIQNRSRRIGGRYAPPEVLRPYRRAEPGICPTITASEFRGCANAKRDRRASRWYNRKLTVDECAYHQGFVIPSAWREVPIDWPLTEKAWLRNIYQAIGNGVPVYMAKAFGAAYA